MIDRNAVNVPISAQDKTGRAFRSARQNIAQFSKAAAVTKIALAALAATAVRLAKGIIDYGSKLTDAATATNTNVEALQALRYAAIEAGASQENLEKALVQVQRTAIEARQGVTSYQRAFDTLGIELDAFIALPTERKLETLGKAIAGAANQQEAYASAIQILGARTAPKLIEVLQRLSVDGFDGVAAAARNAGQVISSETAQSLDAMADAFEQTKTRLKTIGADILVHTLAFFKKDSLEDLIVYRKELEASKRNIEELKKAIADPKGFNESNLPFAGFGTGFRVKTNVDPEKLLAREEKKVATLEPKIKELEEDLRASIPGLASIDFGGQTQLTEQTRFQNEHTMAIAKATTALESLNKSKRTAAEQTAYLEKTLRKEKEILDQLQADYKADGGLEAETKVINQTAKVSTAEKALYLQRKAQAIELNRANDNARAALERYTATTETAAAKTKRLTDELRHLELAQKKMDPGSVDFLETGTAIYNLKTELAGLAAQGKASATTLEYAMDRAAEGMTDAFFSFIQDGEVAFKDFVASILNEIARLQFQKAVANPISDAISAGLSGLFGGGSQTTATASHTGGLAGTGSRRTVHSAAFADAARFHGGGIAGDEIPSILRRGEEVLTPTDPRHRNNLAETAPIVVNFNVNAIDAASFDQTLMRRRALIVSIINEAANRRGKKGPGQ